MITRINPKKTYSAATEFNGDILDALQGEWGVENCNGVNESHIGAVSILQGIFPSSAEAVDLPVKERRFPLYFHDTFGNTNMVIVEKGQKFAKKPENISGGFAVFAVV